MQEDRHIPLLCGFVAFALGAIVIMATISVHDWRITALVRMDPDEPLAPIVRMNDPTFAFVDGGHYDGVYAYAIALDPFATGDTRKLIDVPAYRYGRSGYGWAAAVLSAGSPQLIPYALVILSLVGLGVGGYASALLARRFGWPGLSGLVVGLNPGILIGASVNTSEPLSIAALAVALLAWFGKRRGVAVALLAFLCLTKELFIAVPIGLLLWEFVTEEQPNRLLAIRKRALLLGSALVPLILWWTYLRFALGTWPFHQPQWTSLPVAGWIDTLFEAAVLGGSGFLPSQIGVASLAFVVVIGTAFIIAFVHALRLRTPLDSIFVFFMAIVSIFFWGQLLFPKELFRILAVPLCFVPAVFASPRTRWRPS